MPDEPDNGLTCECGHDVLINHLYVDGAAQCFEDIVTERGIERCPCREFKSAELAKATEQLNAYRVKVDDLSWDLAEANDLIAALKAENAKLVEELGRRGESPVTRLHNICEALQKESAASAYSQEEWNRIDTENVKLTNRLKAADEQYSELSDEAHDLRTKLAARDGLIERLANALADLRANDMGECRALIDDILEAARAEKEEG